MKLMPLAKVHPMAVLRSSVSLLGAYDESADSMDSDSNYLKAVRLQAKIPTIVTAFSRLRKGQAPISKERFRLCR